MPMSDSNTSNWINDWQALQRQYWDAWGTTNRDGPTDSTHGQDAERPWAESVDAWWRAAGVPDGVARNLSAQGRSFLDMGQDVLRQFTELDSGGADAAQAWSQAVQHWLDHARGDQDWGWWTRPFGDYQQFATHMLGLSQHQYEELLASGDGEAAVREQLERWLSLPAFGYTREIQEDLQSLIRAWLAHRAATEAYREQLAQVGTGAAERMQARIAAMAEAGEKISSLRQLFDLWVDAGEEAYSEIAFSPEYRRIYGDLVNTMMVVRQGIQKMLERKARQNGLPTRTELDTAHARIHELRREMRELKASLGQGDDS